DGPGVGVGRVQGDAGGGEDGGDPGPVELLGPRHVADGAVAEVGQRADGDELGLDPVGRVLAGGLPSQGQVGHGPAEPGVGGPGQGGGHLDQGPDVHGAGPRGDVGVALDVDGGG